MLLIADTTPGFTCEVSYVGVYFWYQNEMRKMPGMPGDEEEHPASRSAVCVSPYRTVTKGSGNLHSNTIAIAIKIIRMWWYPNGSLDSPRVQFVSNSSFMRRLQHELT